MKIINRNKGFTLIEVLVSIMVFSFGLLGIAGMMTISVKNNHNGYLRSQANFFAENMADRMRANPVALWNGTYAGTAAEGVSTCVFGSECNYNQLAVFDMEQWAQTLRLSLPNGVGTIACNTNGALPGVLSTADAPAIWRPVPPYDGICTITVTWNEATRNSVAEQQTMSLVVQP